MNKALEPLDNGSNYPFRDKMMGPNIKRSAFDWSHSCVFSLANAGLLLPVMCEEVLPDSDYDLNVNVLLRVLPQVVPLYSSQRYYLYAFYARYSDLYKRASVYMTKGYSGNELLTKPTLKADNLAVPDGLDYVVKAGDLFDALGFQLGKKLSEFGDINALPIFMYEKIYNDYFINSNLHINDRVRLPDDPSDFRLADDGSVISNANATSDFPVVKYGVLRYRDYAEDYFTSSLPFQQRGDAPSLKISLNQFSASADFADLYIGSIMSSEQGGGVRFGSALANSVISASAVNGTQGVLRLTPSGIQVGELDISTNLQSFRTKNASMGIEAVKTGAPLILSQPYSDSVTITPNTAITGGFTLDEFRNLAVSTAELERMARTDGSFAQFGLTFFGIKSKNSNDYFVTFVGGTYRRIAFSEVLQTAPGSNGSTPLGAYGGHGIISDNGYLGHLHTDEHGYLMILLSVMPDVYYTQGISKKFTRLTQAEEFLPGRDKLGLTAIFNKELYVSGNRDADNDLFAYQNPFDEYRYKENRIIGKIGDSSNGSFFPYTQARQFTSTPTYSESFFKADKVRKDYLSAPTEDAYTGRIDFNIRAVEPLSFSGSPAPVI